MGRACSSSDPGLIDLFMLFNQNFYFYAFKVMGMGTHADIAVIVEHVTKRDAVDFLKGQNVVGIGVGPVLLDGPCVTKFLFELNPSYIVVSHTTGSHSV